MADAPEPFRPVLPADAVLDRDAMRRSEPELIRGLLTETGTVVVELHGDAVATATSAGGSTHVCMRTPTPEDVAWQAAGGLWLYVGRVGETAVVAVLRPAQDGFDGATLRQVALGLPETELAILETAVALSHWHRLHPRCPRCGAETRCEQAGWTRVCERDGSQHFPRTDPAVIMAIIDDSDRLLLARGNRWGGAHRSVLAGFVEPGETFEQAVARETFEEAGVVVDDVQYVGNQPWPFPASLMIAFTARARTQTLTPQPGEIEEIGWYSRADVAAGLADGSLRLPGRLSVAHRLIEQWYGAPIAEQGVA